MLNKRKAAIGYAVYVVGSRVAKRAMRRRAHAVMSAVRDRGRPRRRRVIPLAGGAAAAIAGASVIAVRRRHGAVAQH